MHVIEIPRRRRKDPIHLTQSKPWLPRSDFHYWYRYITTDTVLGKIIVRFMLYRHYSNLVFTVR